MKINQLLDTIWRHYYLLSVLLFYFSFLTHLNLYLPLLSVCAWVSLVPLLTYVRSRPLKDVYITSFITGLFGFGVVYYWMGDFGQALPYGKVVIIALIVPCISVFFATKIFVAEYLSRVFPHLTVIIYPSVWIAFDWVQTIGTMAFPWNFWGYTQYPFIHFIQIASIVGIFGITFIVIFSNISIAQYIIAKMNNSNYRHALVACTLCCVIVAASTVYGFIRLHGQKDGHNTHLRVAMVQSCFSPWENWIKNRYEYLNILRELTNKAMQHDPDLVVWSESATLENISYSYFNGNLNDFEEAVLALAASNRVPLLTGEIGVIEDTVHHRYYPQNSMVLINSTGQVVDTYAKIHLVPFGEWFPYGELFPFVNDIVDAFGGSNFVPGDSPRIFTIGSFRCAPLICYENIFHKLCRNYAKTGIDFYVNITNLLWTENPIGPMQHFYFSVFRAIENGIWFVSAGNSGFTALIDPYGRVTSWVPLMKKTYCVGDIDLSKNTSTLYRRCGDSILYISFAFLIVLWAIVIGNTLIAKKRKH
ncbi:MAG: apolipoprotein N-acyltransferase [Spirochaetes bacterium]|nr:apolipoprotein N-acyltransferase [Spirochaetota bacterium]